MGCEKIDERAVWCVILDYYITSKKMGVQWHITSVETVGDVTTICGVAPDGKTIIESTIRKMNLEKLIETYPQMWERHEKSHNSNEALGISIVNRDECYVISKSYFSYDSLGKEYQDRVYGNSDTLAGQRERCEKLNKETNERCENWSKLPYVKTDDCAGKNVICNKWYLGLPVVVFMHWIGQVTTSI